jgi:hypothetical protein
MNDSLHFIDLEKESDQIYLLNNNVVSIVADENV